MPYIPQDVLKCNEFRIQSGDFIMCWFYYIAFIESLFPGKTMLNYTNIFIPNDYEKNGKIIYNYFKHKYDKWKRNPCF